VKKAVSILMLLLLVASMPSLAVPKTLASEEVQIDTAPIHKSVDIFMAGFTPRHISVKPNEVVDVSFSIHPTVDAPDTTVEFFIPNDFIKLIKGEQVWRGDVKKGETTTLQLSISAVEEADVSISAEVKAPPSGKMYRSSYSLQVTSMKPESIQNNEAPSKQVGLPSDTEATSTPESPGTITIEGSWVYINEWGGYSPMRRVLVWLMDDDTGPDEKVASTSTDDNGRYSFTVNNDDGLWQDGRDPYVEVYSQHGWTTWITKTGDLIPAVYTARTPKAGNNVPDGFYYNYGTRVPVANNEAWEAGDALESEAGWIYSLTSWARGTVTINWPKEDWPHSHGDSIHLPDKSTFWWGHVTVHHEYAHSVMWTLYGDSWPSGWGPSPHYVASESSGGFALVEGWAEFMQAAVDNNPTNLASWGMNIENNTWYNGPFWTGSEWIGDSGDMDGSIIEGSVASILWDIFDPGAVEEVDSKWWYDTVAWTDGGFVPIFRVLRYNTPNNILEFWDAYISYWPGHKDDLSTIFWSYGIDKDTYPPLLLIFYIMQGSYTNSTLVTLRIGGWDYGSGIALGYMRFSNDLGVTWSPWYAFQLEWTWTLTSGDGSKRVDAQLKDEKGLVSETKYDTIVLDTTAPTCSITINSGATYTTSTSVTLSLTYSDATSGVYRVRYSNDGVWDTEPWETPAATKAWTLTSGDGAKTVYYQVLDRAGNRKANSDTIVLDTTAPIGSITIGSGNPTYTTTPSVTLYLTYSDATLGVYQVRYSNDGVWDTEPWETPAATKAWTLTAGDGTKKVYYQIKDKAGLTSTTYLDTIILDTTAPTITSFTATPNPFSPNGDGRKDTQTIAATFSETVIWQLQLRTTLGVVLRTWTGIGSSMSIVWDGKDASGAVVADGEYRLRLSGNDLAGLAFTTKTKTVTVDTTAPTVTTVSVSPDPFKPSLGETTTISYTLSEPCRVTIKVFDLAGTLVRTLKNNVLQGAGAQSVVWDGKDGGGSIVPAGTYIIRMFVVDKAGNRASPYPIAKTVTVTT